MAAKKSSFSFAKPTQAHLFVPHSSKWPNIYQGRKLSYYAFLLRMQWVWRKKKKKKLTWQMVLWTLYRESVNSIHYLWGVVVRHFLGDRGRKWNLLFSGLSCCFQQSQGGNRVHSEYYIFIHTVIKMFVYSFAFSLNCHIVRLVLHRAVSHVICTHERQNSVDNFH